MLSWRNCSCAGFACVGIRLQITLLHIVPYADLTTLVFSEIKSLTSQNIKLLRSHFYSKPGYPAVKL